MHAFVLGEHGDSQIVAWSSGTIGGTPLLQIPEIQKMDRAVLAKSVANKAYEIIKAKVSCLLSSKAITHKGVPFSGSNVLWDRSLRCPALQLHHT